MCSRVLFPPLSVCYYLHEAPEAAHESQTWLEEQEGKEKGAITIFISVSLA